MIAALYHLRVQTSCTHRGSSDYQAVSGNYTAQRRQVYDLELHGGGVTQFDSNPNTGATEQSGSNTDES